MPKVKIVPCAQNKKLIEMYGKEPLIVYGYNPNNNCFIVWCQDTMNFANLNTYYCMPWEE